MYSIALLPCTVHPIVVKYTTHYYTLDYTLHNTRKLGL
jgi:hypothetical protein